MTARPLVAVAGLDNVMESIMHIARNVEVWIFGAFGGLVLAACLSGPSERAATAAAPRPATAVSVVAETGLTQPPGAAQPMYVVYVTAKRPSAAEKRASRGQAG